MLSKQCSISVIRCVPCIHSLLQPIHGSRKALNDGLPTRMNLGELDGETIVQCFKLVPRNGPVLLKGRIVHMTVNDGDEFFHQHSSKHLLLATVTKRILFVAYCIPIVSANKRTYSSPKYNRRLLLKSKTSLSTSFSGPVLSNPFISSCTLLPTASSPFTFA